MRFGMLSCCLLIASDLFSPSAMASQPSALQGNNISKSTTSEPAYITDQIKVTLRSGPGLQYKILKMVSTGDKVDTLNSVSNGYTEVQLSDGSQGWVLTRYLIDTPTAAQRLETYITKLTSANQNLAKTSKNLAAKQTQLAQLQLANQKLGNNYTSLEQKYKNLVSISQHAVTIEKENKSMTKLVKAANQKIAYLSQENSGLKRQSEVRWFLAGGGVLLGGLLLGLLLPKLAKKRRDTWFN